jgi:hypothetical protein
MHNIYVSQTRTHEITNFVQTWNEPMKLISMWCYGEDVYNIHLQHHPFKVDV